MSKPSVLFVCVHNAGRSQMAAAFLTHLSQGAVEVRSAGSEPAEQVNPAAVQAMAEVGIDIAAEKPKILTDQAVRESDVVITMGCGDTCPFYPGKRYEDWVLDDPAGKGVDAVRPIRDEIRGRVENLIGRARPRLRPAARCSSSIDRRQRRRHLRRPARPRAGPHHRGHGGGRRHLPELLHLRHPLLRVRGGRRTGANLAHRTLADLEATGMQLLLDTPPPRIDAADPSSPFGSDGGEELSPTTR